MEIGWVGREALPVFQSLLLPGAAAEAKLGDPVTILGAEEGGVACGAPAARLRGPALEVVSLYVAPDHRRRGAGRALTEALLELGRGRAEDLEVSYTATLPDHDTLPPFLAALGFQRDGGEETVYRVSMEELARAPFFAGVRTAPAGVRTFSQLPREALSEAYKAALVQDENYLPGPLTGPEVDARISTAVAAGGQLRSFLAFTAPRPGRVDLAWAKSGKAGDLPLLLRASYLRLRELYPPHTLVGIQAVNPAAAALVKAILPQARPISHTWVRSIPTE